MKKQECFSVKMLPLVLGFLAWFYLAPLNLSAQVSINSDGSQPHPSAMLEVKSTSKGLLIPRLTSVQRTSIVSPANGLLVFDTDSLAFSAFISTDWVFFFKPIAPASNRIVDADGDTWIDAETGGADGDSIVFHLGDASGNGTTEMVLIKNLANQVRLEFPDSQNNTLIGTGAGENMTQGTFNTFLGYKSGFSNVGGASNTFVGNQTGYSNTTGVENTAVGSEALLVNSTGKQNTAVGQQALLTNSIGEQNTAVGWHALQTNTGSNNTGVGSSALASNTNGYDNAAFGINALQANTNGHTNTAIGTNPLYTNTSGNSNAAVGRDALYYNTTGTENTAMGGDGALSSNTTGIQNTAVGNSAMFANTTGNENTAVGYNALLTNSTGSKNTAVGRSAVPASSALSNTTALGFSAVVTASNKVRIGSNSVSVIEGQVDWSFPSDARFKYNVSDNDVPGLALIEKLRPVNYQFNVRKFDEHVMQNLPSELRAEMTQNYPAVEPIQTGFLAQEVEQACKDLNYHFSGLHAPENDADHYSIAYGSFVPLLVKAVQEQQTMIEKQQTEIDKLKQENNRLQALEARILALENQKQ